MFLFGMPRTSQALIDRLSTINEGLCTPGIVSSALAFSPYVHFHSCYNFSLTTSLAQLCGLYYYVWIILLPKWGGYEIVEEIVELDDGARTAHLVRKPLRSDTRSPEQQPLLLPTSP